MFYFKGRKSHKRVTWSDQFFRKGQRKVGTLAYEEMEGGGALGNVGGETGFGAAFRGRGKVEKILMQKCDRIEFSNAMCPLDRM